MAYQFNALVDTGSAISAISQDTWSKISNFAMADVAVFNPADQSDFQTATGAPLKAHRTFKGSIIICILRKHTSRTIFPIP